MSEILNEKYKNKILVASCGKLKFNEFGIAVVDDEELAFEISKLDGFTLVDSPIKLENLDEQISQKEAKAEELPDEEEKHQENDDTASKEQKQELTEEELSKKNVAQLRKIAKDNDIELNGATKKPEMISIILGASL